MDNSKRKYLKIDIMLICFLVILIAFYAATIVGLYKLCHITTEVNKIKNEQQYRQIISESDSIEQSEYLKTIEFLKSESTEFRDFVERQQDYLLWLIGVIGLGAGAIITFFGIKTKKDISEIVHTECREQMNDVITQFVGGNKKVRYLKECIEKEKMAKNKKIKFIFQEARDSNLERIYIFLCEQGYEAEKSVITSDISEERISQIVNGCDMVIYQVSEEECNETDRDKVNYAKISRICNDKKIFGILYCTGPKRTKPDFCDFSFYVNVANFGSTVLERIYNILYIYQG